MANTKIFVMTHKEFDMNKTLPKENYTIITNGFPLVSDKYDIITVPRGYKDEIGGISDAEMSEVYMLRYLYEHQELIGEEVEYIGVNHYRRFFQFMENIPYLSDDAHDCVLPKPLNLVLNLYQQYTSCHNEEDLRLFVDIIKEMDEDVGNDFDVYLNGSLLYPFNMFVVKRDIFNSLMEFGIKALDEFVSRRGGNIQDYVNVNKDKYLKDFSPNNELWCQYRMLGYLFERFSGFYIHRVSKNPLYETVVITEDKYGRN